MENCIKESFEINFEYISFLNRIHNHGKLFFIIGIFAIIVASILTYQFYIALFIGLIFLALIFISVVRWNVYFIQNLRIADKRIYIKVFKYNSILVEGEYDVKDFEFKIERASVSKRGISYKILCKIKDTNFKQFEVQGWDKQIFDKIHKICQN